MGHIVCVQFDAHAPHNDLPPLPPKLELETKPVLKLCIEARAALAELKNAGELIPNQSVLINTIPIREARDSSAIENIVTTEDKLFRQSAMNEKNADPATKETLRYRTALHAGFQEIQTKPLSTSTAILMCRIIKGADIGIRTTPGVLLKNDLTGDTIYTPPEGEALLRALMSNWERFLHNNNDIDPLVRMAVGHYQFEAIHPFGDGNGRTGRALNILFLINEGLLNIPVLYLSSYIHNHRSEYYRLLQDVAARQAWEPWLLFMLKAVWESAQWATDKIHAIRHLMEHTSDYVAHAAPKLHSRPLLDVIFTHPYCKIADIVSAGVAKRAAASRYLRKLEEIKVLYCFQEGREKYFVHPKFLDLLVEEQNQFETYDLFK